MANVVLNKKAVENAEKLIKMGEITTFDTNWEAEKPTVDEVIYFLETHNVDEYGLWFLGQKMDVPKNLKEHYDYPYGDLKTVQRPALVDTIKRAEKAGHAEIVKIAKHLLAMVDKRGK